MVKIPVKIGVYDKDGKGFVCSFNVSKTSKSDLVDCVWAMKQHLKENSKAEANKIIIEYV